MGDETEHIYVRLGLLRGNLSYRNEINAVVEETETAIETPQGVDALAKALR